MRAWLTTCGALCDICGVEHRAPAGWLVDLLFVPHDVWARFTGWHRRLGVLWLEAYERGAVLSMPWPSRRGEL
jgi:hypothetical protein